jgi:Replication-relaxation
LRRWQTRSWPKRSNVDPNWRMAHGLRNLNHLLQLKLMSDQPTIPLEKRRRLPSLKRVEQNELPAFRLTARDVEIIRAVYEYRCLTAPQVEALFFTSVLRANGPVNTNCQHRLKMLYHSGYLFRDEQPSKLSEGRKPLVYFLDRKGAEFLGRELGVTVEWDRGDNDVSYPFLGHLLATNEVRVAVTLSARKHKWDLLTWLDDKTLKGEQMKDKVTIKGDRGGRVQAAVVPDSYFRLDAREDIYNFFLEVDRGTVTGEATQWGRRDWGRKVKAYLEYYKSGMYKKRYQTADMRILTVTTGETRLAHLKEITEEAGGKARFWFSTFDRVKQGDILTDAIWNVATRAGLAALTPPETTSVFVHKPTSG